MDGSQRDRRRLKRRAWFVVGCAVAAVISVVAAQRLLPWYLARQIASRLDTMTAAEAQQALADAAQLGDAGTRLLVAGLGSERESVASAAESTLGREVERWQLLAPDEAAAKLRFLAAELAGAVDDFDRPARTSAARLATRIASWPMEDADVDRGLLLADCEAVIRSVRARPLTGGGVAGSPRVGPWAALEDGDLRQASATSEDTDRRELAVSEEYWIANPGGDLPITATNVPSLPPVLAEAGDGAANLGATVADVAPSPEAGDSTSEPQAFDAQAAKARPLNEIPEGPRLAEAGPEVRRMSVDVVDEEPVDGDNPLRAGQTPVARDPYELMQQLHSKDARQSAAAQAELLRRGVSQLQMEMARRMVDPDPAVRRELLESLFRQPGVDPIPWLLWMSRDESVDIRRDVVAMMATTGEPELMRRVEELAANDPDADVRQQAAKAIAAGQ